MGFRGEALASMTYVGHVTVTTITKGQLHGYRLCILLVWILFFKYCIWYFVETWLKVYHLTLKIFLIVWTWFGPVDVGLAESPKNLFVIY